MIVAILGFLAGMALVPAGMLCLSVGLSLIAMDMMTGNGSRVGLLLLFPAGSVLLIFGGARLMRGKFGSWTFIQLALGSALAVYMVFLYQPLFRKVCNYAVEVHKASAPKAAKKKAPGSKVVRSTS